MQIHEVKGGDGLRLHVREWGNRNGIPLLFIHGWSQSHLCWTRQYNSDLQKRFRLLALDLRGHGQSECPIDASAYTNGALWAADIAAIVEQLSLDHPILVGWSYGGYVICDYLQRYGEDAIAGIALVAAGVVLGPKAFGPLIGPAFLQHAPPACEPDLPTNILAIRNFLRACLEKEIPSEDFESAIAYNMIVDPRIRGFLIQRELDFAPVLESLTVPVQIVHSRSDNVVLPAMSEYVAAHCKSAKILWLEGVGHASFLETPNQFNQALAEFAEMAAHRHKHISAFC